MDLLLGDALHDKVPEGVDEIHFQLPTLGDIEDIGRQLM
jgi:hypothetical protein